MSCWLAMSRSIIIGAYVVRPFPTSATFVRPPFGAQCLQLLPGVISPLPECAVIVRLPYGALCFQLPLVPAPDEVVDFVVRMPKGQALSANFGINTKFSLSSLLGMHGIMSCGVHSTIEFAPTELFQDPSTNYEPQPQPGEEEELEAKDQSRTGHELLQRRWLVAAIPRDARDSAKTRAYSAQDRGKIAARLADAVCRNVHILGRTLCAARCKTAASRALSVVSSSFSGRAGNVAAAILMWAPDELHAGKSRRLLVAMLRMCKPSSGSSAGAGTGAATSGPALAIGLTVLARRKHATTSTSEAADGDPVVVACSCNTQEAAIAHAKQQSTSC
jgi:hypothetical protein